MKEFAGYKKGVNLGGWLSQCGEGNYTEERFNTFIVESDMDVIKNWGADHVRLPIDYNVLQTEDGAFIESGFGYVDKCISWCKARGLNMVLDLHKTKGYVFDDETYCNFFDDAGLQEQFISLWLEITRRYGQYHDMITFELLNEVTDMEFAEKWNGIAARTIAAIRELNKDVKIMIGGIYNSSIEGLFHLDRPVDPNMVYTFHCYSPMIFTHQRASWVSKIPSDFVLHYPGKVAQFRNDSKKYFGDDFDSEFATLEEEDMNEVFFLKLMERAVALAEDYDVPLYCGEYGVIDRVAPEEALAWYKDIHAALDKYQISRAAWSYKQMDFGLSDARMDEIRDELIKYL